MKKIFRILIILIILVIFNTSCLNNDVNKTNNLSNIDILKDYNFDKVIEMNTLENLKKETGYYRFSLRSMEDYINPCTCYAYDKYLIFRINEKNISIVTDKSSSYVIEDNKIKEHRKLNNYNQDSFIIDKSLHDTDIETTEFDGKIFQKYLSSSNSAMAKLKYLDESFPEIFHFKDYNYPGIIMSYYINPVTYELSGYNILGTIEDSDSGTNVIYMFGNTKKDLSDNEKEYINNILLLINE